MLKFKPKVYTIKEFFVYLFVNSYDIGMQVPLHQLNWPPQYNWNIVESGIEHPNPACPTLVSV
jgi:hypothetical protein